MVAVPLIFVKETNAKDRTIAKSVRDELVEPLRAVTTTLRQAQGERRSKRFGDFAIVLMQKRFSDSLIQAISSPRLGSYRSQETGGDVRSSIAHYMWNITLSESLYPCLQGAEITLRNSMNDSASNRFNSKTWFDTVLIAPEISSLNSAKTRTIQQNKAMPPDNIVAQTIFGFWVGLFHNRYEKILWPQLLRDVFPNMPRELRTRSYAFGRLRRIRNLRNRVFHYEPIWQWHDLEQNHQETLEVIGWINPEMLSVVETMDRFPYVYAEGPEKYRAELLRLGGNQV